MTDADEELVEVRVMLPRSAIVARAPSPELVSQENAFMHFGLSKRRFLEIVRSPRFAGRVLRSGRLRLVKPADLLAHLEAEEARQEPTDEAPAPPSSVAERLGLERAPTSRRRKVG